MFTQLLIPADQIQAETDRTYAAATQGGMKLSPVVLASSVIAQRLRQRPDAYLEFGPYWWAVKKALRDSGEDFGVADDEILRAAYGGDLGQLKALVAGELFKDFYRRTYLVGSSQFWLDDEAEESYVLYDSDMEARRTGPGALRVSADIAAIPQPPDPENAY